MNVGEIIRMLQDEHCRKCRIGQVLINLKPLLDQTHAPARRTNKKSLSVQPAARAPAGKKTCKLCGETKPLEEFPRHPQCKDGRTPTCKVCSHEQKKKKGAIPRPRPQPSPPPQSRSARLQGVVLKFHCAACHANFMTQKQLDEHNRVYHDGKTANCVCEICDREFATLGDLNDHVEAMHGEF